MKITDKEKLEFAEHILETKPQLLRRFKARKLAKKSTEKEADKKETESK